MLLNWLNSQKKITLKKGCKKCKILLNYSWLTGQSKIGMEKGRCRPTWSHFRQFWRNFRTREPTPAIPQSKPNILHLKYPLLFRLKPFWSKTKPNILHLKYLLLFWLKPFLSQIKLNILHVKYLLLFFLPKPFLIHTNILHLFFNSNPFFLAVQDSSIGDLVTHSLSHSLMFWFHRLHSALQS